MFLVNTIYHSQIMTSPKKDIGWPKCYVMLQKVNKVNHNFLWYSQTMLHVNRKTRKIPFSPTVNKIPLSYSTSSSLKAPLLIRFDVIYE